MSPHEKAQLMITTIRNALAEGTKHFDPETKKPLNTVEEIRECLSRLGRVEIQPPKSLAPGLDVFKKITKRAEIEEGWLDITLECGHELQVISNAAMEVGDEAPCAECLGEYIDRNRKKARKASMN